MEFKEFKELQQQHVQTMFENPVLFVTDTTKDELWDIYLNSFPEGTNEIFRERREFDCSCCRHFIKAFGNVVVIKNNKLISIWDFETGSEIYQPVINALSKYVKSKEIRDVFVSSETGFGTDKNRELRDEEVFTWHHFRVNLPLKFRNKSSKSNESLMGTYRDSKNVLKRSLEEISEDSIDTVLDLIAQNSLYKGKEWESILKEFLKLHKEYNKLPIKSRNNFCWEKSMEVGAVLSKIRNHSIGVLLTDISEGMDINVAVSRYEKIVAPSNYKRPKAIFTKKMIENAQKTLTDLGLIDSLGRRFATIDDITVNNILFANKDSLKRMGENVFDELQKEATSNSKKFDRLEEVSIENFINNILPRTKNIEVYFENKHSSNLVSLIAPKMENPSMFKWNNGFSWAYNGNITDSMKERVKAAGGNVEGVLRFSIQWNENGENQNDFDAHCLEPKGNLIYYGRKTNINTTGKLDVDIIRPGNKIAVENITWTNKSKMQKGKYTFMVHTYSYRQGRSGFSAEIEYNGQIYSYEYRKDSRQNEKILVAEIEFDGKDIKFIKSLPSTESTKTIWNIPTNNFYPVSVCMFSPNYWDDQKGIGHKHYFFMINDCKNDETPNGFFNEFLKQDLMEHKRVFEALGSKMKVEDSDNQLSGLGFSSTKRNTLVCKVEGHINRTIKLLF